jgi:hypothetical protein
LGVASRALPRRGTPDIFVFTLTSTTLLVSTTGSGTGVVYSNSNPVSCSAGTCGTQYHYGDPIQLTTSASTGSFKKWGGDCAGQVSTCSLTMDKNHNVSAEFDLAATPAPTTATPTAATPTGPRPTKNNGSAGNTPGAPSSPDASGSPGLEVLGATAVTSDLALLSTPAASSADQAPAIPAPPSNSDGPPWIPAILLLVLLIVGVNIAIFQVNRSRRPPA